MRACAECKRGGVGGGCAVEREAPPRDTQDTREMQTTTTRYTRQRDCSQRSDAALRRGGLHTERDTAQNPGQEHDESTAVSTHPDRCHHRLTQPTSHTRTRAEERKRPRWCGSHRLTPSSIHSPSHESHCANRPPRLVEHTHAHQPGPHTQPTEHHTFPHTMAESLTILSWGDESGQVCGGCVRHR